MLRVCAVGVSRRYQSARRAGFVVPPVKRVKPERRPQHRIKGLICQTNHRDARCAPRLVIISTTFLFLAVIQVLTTNPLNLQIRNVKAFRPRAAASTDTIPAKSGP